MSVIYSGSSHLKDGDFVTTVTASNKGITESELSAVANGHILKGQFTFCLTGQTAFTVPLPTAITQTYFDVATLTPYTANGDLSGWTAGTPIALPTTGSWEWLINDEFWDLTTGSGLSGRAIYSVDSTPNWLFETDKQRTVDNATLDIRVSDGAFEIKDITAYTLTNVATTLNFGGGTNQNIVVATNTFNSKGQVSGSTVTTYTMPTINIVANEATALAQSAADPSGVYAWEEV
ncbi:hypothetical protein FACS189465_3380 [Clostridia bacterium]|nr:hypothetical protein FACS189465_3380 [Clostridia bacterium]